MRTGRHRLLVLLLAAGCASAGGSQPRTLRAEPNAVVEMAVGESVRLLGPGDDFPWRLSGGDGHVTADPAPGVAAAAWTLTGRARGDGDLTLEAVIESAPCPAPPDCPPMPAPPRIVLRFVVR